MERKKKSTQQQRSMMMMTLLKGGINKSYDDVTNANPTHCDINSQPRSFYSTTQVCSPLLTVHYLARFFLFQYFKVIREDLINVGSYVIQQQQQQHTL